MHALIDVPPGLNNVAVADTEIGSVDGDAGFYHYREYDAVDLARRTGQVLGLLATPPHRRALLHETLLPRLVAVPGPPLVVPEEHADWVRARAVRVRDALLRAGYPVHGDPDSLLPGTPVAPSCP